MKFKWICGLLIISMLLVGKLCDVVFARISQEDRQSVILDAEEDGENEDDTKSADEDVETLEADDGWKLLLVNPWNEVPEDFTVELKELDNGHAVDARIYEDLQKMLDDARAEGLSPIICSSYRTQEKQEQLFQKQITKYLEMGYSTKSAKEEASKWVAYPGTSEHQTGLAVDIVALDYQVLDNKQEETPEQEWLMENSYQYGFILRYPNEKSEITGIYYEPWHYRYVGKEAAKEIYEKEICLEEYLNEVSDRTLLEK